MTTPVGSGSSFPQTGPNRTRSELVHDIASWIASDSADTQARAFICLRDAIRRYNTVPWKFNRAQASITLTTATTYSLNSTFRNPLRAYLWNASSQKVGQPVRYVPYPVFVDEANIDNFTQSIPELYSVRNPHADGLVTIWPRLGSVITYPTMRLEYHSRLVVPSGDSNKIDCPIEVEQGIVDLAVAKLIAMEKGSREAVTLMVDAQNQELQLRRLWRDWSDIPAAGVGV